MYLKMRLKNLFMKMVTVIFYIREMCLTELVVVCMCVCVYRPMLQVYAVLP